MLPDGIKVEFYEDKSIATSLAHHHLHFMSADPDAERAWWEKAFGATTTSTPAKDGASRKVTTLPGATLQFTKVDAARAKTQGRTLDHTGVGVKNVDEFCKGLAAKGVMCERAGGGNIAFVTDPAGVRVEINQGLENR
jgi:catechol 2,3-dioxygenase-like lactoylglutathione lyase family enzyme